jgi:hypothetical protein
MTRLVTQPTAAPTRKMLAVILSGIVTATVQTLLETYAPGLPITEVVAQIDVWVQALVMAGFGYAVKDRLAAKF